MILGTHNTMTYLKPKQWYLRPIKFLARCQSVDYKTQVEKYGVKCLDLRLFWDKKGNLEYRHGMFRYDASNFEEVLSYCNERKMAIRILFELRSVTEKRDDLEELKQRFAVLCSTIEEKYPSIYFYGGSITDTGEVLYNFRHDIHDIGYYSSVTTLFTHSNSKILSMLDDWCPYLYAKLKNHKNHLEFDPQYADENCIVMYDFIEIE